MAKYDLQSQRTNRRNDSDNDQGHRTILPITINFTQPKHTLKKTMVLDNSANNHHFNPTKTYMKSLIITIIHQLIMLT